MTISHTDSTLVTRNEPARAVVAPLLDKVLATEPGSAPLVARLALGAILFPHGAQHALGWFGGYGFSGTLAWMTGSLGFPAPLAALGIVTELLAPLALIAGAGGRVAAALLFFHMGFAASIHFKHGFFMNWFGSLATGEEGFEYHLLAMALAVVVAILGSGSFSIDRKLARARVTSGAS